MKTVNSPFRRSWARVYRIWRRGHYRILAGQLRDLVGSYVAVLAIAGIVMWLPYPGAKAGKS